MALADELTAAVRGLDVYLHAYLAAAEPPAGRVASVRVITWERTVELAARAFVDTSGDAVVAHQAPKGASNLTLGVSAQPGEVICKLALSGIVQELAPGRDLLTLAEQEGRRRARAVVEFLRSLPPFARAFVSHVAPQVGVRESRRVVGRYQLTREDVLAGRKFGDAVVQASWPIELWADGHPGALYEYLEDGETYDIPGRCLQARDVSNLFVAGRCLSATREALGSARVIGTCLATGEAAGALAASRATEG
jgi:hypothetical protein